MRRRALVVVLCSAVVAACGGSTPKKATASSVCAAERQAAVPLLGAGLAMRIADRDPANIECLLSRQGITVYAVAQASAQAWNAYDTVTVHLVQAFGAGRAHVSSELPVLVPSVGGNAVWVPAQSELIATNGTPTAGGSYLTVKVTRRSSSAPAGLAVAQVVGRAALEAAPRGPNPASS